MAKFFGKDGGEWADAGSLDMGTGSRQKKTKHCLCYHCNHIHAVNEKTIGLVCRFCNKYFTICTEKNNVGSIDRLIEIGGIIDNAESTFHIPNKPLLKFRNGMEKKAYEWKDKQIKNRKQPNYEPVHHGPIDPKTGRRMK